tara:strand:- start:299 stop:670 length:372 start_codon:yes stop_codon:yes gene_type:complete
VIKIEKGKQIIVRPEISLRLTPEQVRKFIKASIKIQAKVPTSQEEIRRETGTRLFYKLKTFFEKTDKEISKVFSKEDEELKRFWLYVFGKGKNKGTKRKIKTIKQNGVFDSDGFSDKRRELDD